MINVNFLILHNKKSGKYFFLSEKTKQKEMINSGCLYNISSDFGLNFHDKEKADIIEFEDLKELDKYVKDTIKIWNGEITSSKSNHSFFAKE